jgi:hypothetical protein
MKKILSIVLFSSIFFSLSVHFVLAKSGCCSGHGGVSCSAGPQSDGSVICNDGWTGSSCAYSGMVMCGGSSTSSSLPTTQETITQPLAPVTIQPLQVTLPVRPVVQKTIEEIKQDKCEALVKNINTRIKVQEKLKETTLQQFYKLVTNLEKKKDQAAIKELNTAPLVEQIDGLSNSIEDYRLAYDDYTNKMYQTSWVACDDDQEQFIQLRKEEKDLSRSLIPYRQAVQKLYSLAQRLKLLPLKTE